jgi:charged multivesicular body protein 4
MFGRLFGTNQTKKKVAAPNLNDSIQQLRQAVTQLEKREVHLDKKIQVCLNNAKAKSKRRDKKGALFELKKKKQLENQLQSIQGKKLNLETQIMALEDAHLNKETLKAMKTSANAMKATVKESDLDKADELMEDINEAMDQVNEMNEAMSQPLGQMMDDDELEAELAELEEMEADELLNDMADAPIKAQPQTNVDDLVDVPSHAPQKKQEEDEDAELAELNAMFN